MQVRGFTVYSDWKLFMTLTKLLTQNWPLRVQPLFQYVHVIIYSPFRNSVTVFYDNILTYV